MKTFKDFINENSNFIQEDSLFGGEGDSHTPESLAKLHDVSVQDIENQIEIGIKIEMKHTDQPNIARELAMDNLVDDPFYYTHLDKIEKYHSNPTTDHGKVDEKAPGFFSREQIVDFLSSKNISPKYIEMIKVHMNYPMSRIDLSDLFKRIFMRNQYHDLMNDLIYVKENKKSKMKHIQTYEQFNESKKPFVKFNDFINENKEASELLKEDVDSWFKAQLDRELDFLKQGVDDTENIAADEIANIINAWIEDHTGIDIVVLKHYPETVDVKDFVTQWVMAKA